MARQAEVSPVVQHELYFRTCIRCLSLKTICSFLSQISSYSLRARFRESFICDVNFEKILLGFETGVFNRHHALLEKLVTGHILGSSRIEAGVQVVRNRLEVGANKRFIAEMSVRFQPLLPNSLVVTSHELLPKFRTMLDKESDHGAISLSYRTNVELVYGTLCTPIVQIP
jgi:hypothetical protein